MEKIEEKFREIDKLFDKLSAKNKVQLENAQIKPIHAKYPFAQNGICAFIAPMGSGKSYNYMKLAAQQEVLNDEPFFELIVICSTSAKFDQTVQTFLPSIKKSKIVSVKDTELLDWLNKYMRRILKYNSINEYINTNCKNINEELMRLIMKHNLANKKPKVMKYIINKLMKYNWRTFPHRCLLILDDFANHALLRSKETDLSRLLKKLRHFHINVMICVQTVKSIPKDIKLTLSDIVLFPGISQYDFEDLIKESPASAFDFKKLWDEYNKLKDPHATFTIQTAKSGDQRAILTRKIQAMRTKKYIGAYMAELNRVDAIVFTGGNGENNACERTLCASDMECLGVKLDEKLNENGSRKESLISAPDSKVKVFVIPTDEEYEIAKETMEVVSKC